jgi:glycosyltransferase involved in cell wall biosynthesis
MLAHGDDTPTSPEPLPAAAASAPTVVLDCRWLGMGGAGRVTELVLTGLRQAPPSGRWLLWGDPDRVIDLAFAGADVVPWRGDPTRLFGQADLPRVPRGDVVVYLHQVRPLRPGRSVTVIHDTIPLRFDGNRAVRGLKRLFLRSVARLSDAIVTVSPASRDAIVRDLQVRSSRVRVTSLGIDADRVGRIRAMRARSERADVVVFVGRFAAHKNLRRLCRAFVTTRFAAAGGRLVLVGGSRSEAEEMAAWARGEGLPGVDVRGACPEDELDLLLATCRALVQPSLEEGYGLPAVEAAAAGVQVAASRTGAAPTIPSDRVSFMDPLDEASIAAAIDAAVARPDAEVAWAPRVTVAPDILAAVRRVLAGSASDGAGPDRGGS